MGINLAAADTVIIFDNDWLSEDIILCTPCQRGAFFVNLKFIYRMYFQFGENFKLENAGFTDVY